MEYGLRIRQVYFDAILSGEKTFELRDLSPRYANIMRATSIMLHYQRPRRLVADVVRCKIIDTPLDDLRSGALSTPKCYKIDLANPREFHIDEHGQRRFIDMFTVPLQATIRRAHTGIWHGVAQ